MSISATVPGPSDGFEPLATLLARGRPATHPVARERGELLRYAGFAARVSALHAAVSADALDGARFLVVMSGSADFAAALLAIWQAGGIAVLPPNAQPATLAELAQDAVGILSDAGELPRGLPVVHPSVASDAAAASPHGFAPLDPARPCLELLTSGTTSARKRCSKTLSQLDAEFAALEALFGASLCDAEVLGSASHQHLYGLTFRVLWPLAAGRVFHAERVLHAEEILGTLPAATRALLVSVPAQLRRLARRSALDALAPVLRDVFSSAGPLDAASADRIEAVLGRAPLEGYGSTETGLIAWRRQGNRPDRLDWTPLPEVRVSVEAATGLLCVTSPFASAMPEPETVRTADRAVPRPEGRFQLLGRADRVVKIAEKAVSLPELEQHLCEHPWVDAAACLRLEGRGEPRIGAAVVTSEAGSEALAREGRLGMGRVLAGHLATRWDPVVLPRSWRYVDELPSDEQGKLPVALLQALFATAEAATVREVEQIAETRGGDYCERVLRVPEDLTALEGHFPDLPIVPGVAQLQWVFAAAREGLGIDSPPRQIAQLKFRRLLRPGRKLTVRVEREGAAAFQFRLFDGEETFASGRVRFGSDEETGR